MKLKYKIIFIIILLFALFLRVVILNKSPANLGNDEISIAYDAYSISKTMRDQHNHFLPISFQSYNTYKAPLMIYANVPFIILLGNTDYSARLASAIAGVFTILVIGLLIYEWTQNEKLSILTSFILTITPWHIYTSRMDLESNLALLFLILGIYLFYKGINKFNPIVVILSYISFTLSIYSYHTEWGLTPLIILSLYIINWKKIRYRKEFHFGLLLFFILLIPIIKDYLSNLHTTARANTENILNDPRLKSVLNSNVNVIKKFSAFIFVFLGTYSTYTNFKELFFTGLHVPFSTNPYEEGLFLSSFLPFFVIGLFYIKKFLKSYSNFFYAWLIISPIVPSLTINAPNEIRNLPSVLPYVIIISVGIYAVYERINSVKIKFISIIILFLVPFFYFCLMYYHHFPIQTAEDFQYGYRQVADFIKPNYNKYQQIIVDPKFGSYGQYDSVAFLYIPYYTDFPPKLFLAERKDTPNGLYYGKYVFREIHWNQEKFNKKTLYIVPNYDSPPKNTPVKLLYTIKLPYGKPEFKIYSYGI